MHLVSGFLLRAPLLPVRALAAPARALLEHPMGAAAIELASPELTAALARGGGGPARASLARYARRAAFRPTPAGLFAGVLMGRLGARTGIRTGAAEAALAPSWSVLAALGRGLLDEPVLRPHVRLRCAPSLLAWGGEAVWLETTAVGPRWSGAELDEQLTAVVDAARDWIGWSELQQIAAATGIDPDDADQLLLALVDRGLLHHDLQPPLVGPPPSEWVQRRLRAFPDDEAVRTVLDPVADALAQAGAGAADVAACRTALRRLPGAGAQPGLNAVLRLGGAAVLDRRAVARAAALAPLLFRLQEAMSPPVSERVLDGELVERLGAVTEFAGAGALPWAPLATGGYGVSLRELDEEERVAEPPRLDLLTFLAGRLAASAGARVLQLEVAELEPLLPEIGAPPSFELFLTPAREPARARPGTGWMLGLHAPAGATLGRFAAALGDAATAALGEMAAAEQAARLGELTVDVAYAASPGLADLGTHPPVRPAALAISSWPDGPAVTAGRMELVMDPAIAGTPALRLDDGTPIAPAPLHRVRSTTAPRGLLRLLCGWSFARQHAPWAFGWGPLARLERLPRVVLDGFVLAPASWCIPTREQLRRRGTLARWRRELGVPDVVQVGEGDELLYVDLRAPGAAGELERFAEGRACEIWPPLDTLVDAGGRRVEAVVSVVNRPEADESEALRASLEAVRACGRVAPPAEEPPAAGWTTFRIFGAEERQPLVLRDAVAPAVAEARAAGEIDGWFFLPYVEPGTARHHLRVRVHGRGARFQARLQRHLAESRAFGDVTTVETAEYFRESARYGGAQLMPAVEALFEASSDVALAVLETESVAAEPWPEGERAVIVARACEALAQGLGLGPDERHQLALAQWNAAARASGEPQPLRQLFRRRSRGLGELFGGTESDALTPALDALASRAAALPAETRQALRPALPVLLHVGSVRLAGPRPEEEAAAYFLWERTLAGLRARRRKNA